MEPKRKSGADILRVGEHYLTASSEATEAIVATGSHQALAIWFYLLNKPVGWIVRRTDVLNQFPKLSKQAYADAMRVLEAVGVVRRVAVIVDGKMAGSRVLVSATFIRDEDIKRGESPSVQFRGRSVNSTARNAERSVNPTVRAGGHLPSTGVIPREGLANDDELIDKSAPKKRASSALFPPPDGWTLEECKDYLQARRGKGHPMTPAALKLATAAIYKTNAAGIPMRLIIDELVATGWRTVKPKYFEDKEDAKNNNTRQARQSVVDRVAAATGLNPHDPSSFDFELFSDEHDRRNSAADGGQVVAVDGEAIRVQVD